MRTDINSETKSTYSDREALIRSIHRLSCLDQTGPNARVATLFFIIIHINYRLRSLPFHYGTLHLGL